MLTAGIYSLVGFEVTPATIIGLLTILGFSLYDTVVVFDKVDENTKGILGGSRIDLPEAANLAVNQTLMRSINTSLIALLPVAGLLFVGAGLLGVGTLKDLALVLFVGLAAGALLLDLPGHADGLRPQGAGAEVQGAGQAGLAQRRAAEAGEGRPARAPAAGARPHRRRRRPPRPATKDGAAGRAARPTRTKIGSAASRRRRPVRGTRRRPAGRRRRRPRPAAPAQQPRPGARPAEAAGAEAGRRGRPSAKNPVTGRPRAVAARCGTCRTSRKPGIVFKDLTPLFADGPVFGEVDRAIADRHAAGRLRRRGRRGGARFPVRRRRRVASGDRRGADPQGRQAAVADRLGRVRAGVRRGGVEVHEDAFADRQRVLWSTTCSPPAARWPRPPTSSGGPAAGWSGCRSWSS